VAVAWTGASVFLANFASKTSTWIILPLGPVPTTPDKLIFVSWAVFLAKGEAMTLPSYIFYKLSWEKNIILFHKY